MAGCRSPVRGLLLATACVISLVAPAAAVAQSAERTPAGLPPALERARADAVEWLAGQMVPNEAVPAPEASRRRLLLSYRVPPDDPDYRTIHGRSALYDDSLAAVAFAMARRYRESEYVLGALSRLVRPDGGLWFTYNTQNDWPSESDHGGAISRTGAVAWAGYAITYYLGLRAAERQDFASADPLGIRLLKSAEEIAGYILALQVPAGPDPRAGLVAGGTGSVALALPEGRPDPEEVASEASVEWVSTEHNIDAWYFLRDLGRLTRDARYSDAAQRIKSRVLDLWSERDGQFIQGIHPDRKPDTALPLDTASWGAIFLLSQGRDAQAGRCLQIMDRRFALGGKGVNGYRPYAREPVYADPRVNRYYYPGGGGLWSDLRMVWYEGSFGAAAAHARGGRTAQARAILESLAGHAVEGGFRYASISIPYQFSSHPSVASTAWFVIAAELLRGSPEGALFWGN
jgi:hypothetical protein